MPLKYAILGLLAREPMHGYALGRALNHLLDGLWPVNPGQVHATLERLARDAMVTPAMASSSLPPGSSRAREFSLSPAGRRALQRWLDRPASGALPRSTLAERLVVHAWSADRDAIARLLAAHRERCTATRARLESARRGSVLAEREGGAEGSSSPGDLQLVARAAREHLDAELAWLAVAEQELVAATAARPDDRD